MPPGFHLADAARACRTFSSKRSCFVQASGLFHFVKEAHSRGTPNTAVRSTARIACVQTINDWYDREIDAINEPYRPIPSGAISEVMSLFAGQRYDGDSRVERSAAQNADDLRSD